MSGQPYVNRTADLAAASDVIFLCLPGTAEVEATIPVVKAVMEQAALPALTLRVPLAVDARAASNWDEAH